MTQLHHPIFTTSFEKSIVATDVKLATITSAHFGTQANTELGLTLTISCAKGTVLALYDVHEMWQLMAQLQATHPGDLVGRTVHAHFLGRKLLGISSM